jgi:hypothetical protein
MPDDTKEQDRHEAPLNEAEDGSPSRRSILLGSTALVAAATMASNALAQTQKAAPAPASSSGRIYNEMCSHYDLLPTFAAAGGDPEIVEKSLRGAQIGSKTFKVHLDGFNLVPFFKGEAKEAPRNKFVYWNDDGQLVAIRVNDWKCVFLEQDHKGIGVWSGQFTELRLPKLFNLRSDPFERGDESILYDKWMIDRAFVKVPMQALAAQWLQSFKEFPVRQKPASFNLDAVMAKLEKAGANSD